MTYNENMKKSIYKWRENNKEKYNSYMILPSRQWKEKIEKDIIKMKIKGITINENV